MGSLQKLALIGSGAIIGGSFVMSNWTIVKFDPVQLLIGLGLVILNWKGRESK